MSLMARLMFWYVVQSCEVYILRILDYVDNYDRTRLLESPIT